MMRVLIPSLVLVLAADAAAQFTCDTALPMCGVSFSGNTALATPSPSVTSCTNPTSKSVWYHHTPAASGTLTLSLCVADGGAAGYDSALAIYSGACGSLTSVACNDDSCDGLSSKLSNIAVTGGVTYHIRVHGFGSGAGTYTMAVSGTAAPSPNPPFVMSIPGGPGSLSIVNSCRTPGDEYFTALSFDTNNAANPGTGWWQGLHIHITDLITEHIQAIPPFRGQIDGSGGSSYILGDGTIPPQLFGTTLWGVTTTFNPTTGYLTGVTNLASVVFN